MIDRLPPQSLEAEQSVLGAILIDRDAVIEVAEFLRPRTSTGRRTAGSTRRSSTCSSGASPSTSSPSPRRSSVARSSRRSAVAPTSRASPTRRPTAVHAAQYARIVERKAVLRNLIGAAGRIAGIGYEDPAEIDEAIDRAEAELFAVSQKRVDVGFSAAQGAPPRRLRPARLPPRPPRRDQRRADRVHRPRRADDRASRRATWSSSRPGHRSARRASRSTSRSTPRSRSARASASSASR